MKKIITVFLFFFMLATRMEVVAEPPYFVGELGDSWQFPSDHLPRGAAVGNFHIAFWNILNKNYLGHIEENSQGLRHSSILKDNRPLEPNYPLTIRELLSIEIILEMIHHPTHPRSLIALQETHEDVQDYLKQILPENWKIATPLNQTHSQDIFLYDGNLFELLDSQAIKYSPKQAKTIFTITLLEKTSNREYRFLQSHIPGGPISAIEGCAKFSEEALKQYDPNLTTVLMGDMNQSPETMQTALEKAAQKLSVPQPFTYLPIDYPSHINTKCEASWIDHFFIYSPNIIITGSHLPEELCDALPPMVQLLREKQ